MLSDIQISTKAKMEKINIIANKLNVCDDDLEYYGWYKAKLSDSLYKKLENKEDGKFLLQQLLLLHLEKANQQHQLD